MRITFEKHNNLKLIYIYLREFNGKLVQTISGVKCELLLSEDNNWIGINIFEENVACSRIILPPVKDVAEAENIKIEQGGRRISIIFIHEGEIFARKKERCNIDFNEDGYFGIELLLHDFECKTDSIKPFTIFRGTM